MPYMAAKPTLPNPIFIPVADPDYVYDGVVDVVDDYLPIQAQIRPQVIGNTITEGRVDTLPDTSATVLEPWKRDTVTPYDRLEATFQTQRRRSLVRVIPAPGGFMVNVEVYKELEDLPRPERATSGAATFRNDSSISRFNEPVGGQALTQGWIPEGRNPNLEQKILCKLQSRFGASVGCPVPGYPEDMPADGAIPPEAVATPPAEPPMRLPPP